MTAPGAAARVAPAVALVGSSIVMVGSVLGWARSGSSVRNSYALVRSARTLGIVEGSLASLAAVWFAVPVVVGLAWLAFSAQRWRSLGLCSLIAGLLAIGAAGAVQRAPLGAVAGLWVTLGGGVVAVGGGLATMYLAQQVARHPQRRR